MGGLLKKPDSQAVGDMRHISRLLRVSYTVTSYSLAYASMRPRNMR